MPPRPSTLISVGLLATLSGCTVLPTSGCLPQSGGYGCGHASPAPPATAAAPATANAVAPVPAAAAARRACSQEFSVKREDFWSGTGARGTIATPLTTLAGWAMFDTGGSYTRVRAPDELTGADAQDEIAVDLTFGSWHTRAQARYSPALRAFFGPKPDGSGSVKGNQMATIGSALMSHWAVRFTPGAVFVSSDAAACSAQDLRGAGFHPMDSSGFYQRAGVPANVKSSLDLDLVIPTVNATILGTQVPVQIDTGYQTPDLQVQVNEALYRVLETQLGPQSGTAAINGSDVATFKPSGATIAFIDSDTGKPFGSVSNLTLVRKPANGGGIASWGIPAGMISGKVFAQAFDTCELRADQAKVWVVPRQ